jgi:hypothetical protein
MPARMPKIPGCLPRRIVNAIASSSRPSLLGTSKVGNNPSPAVDVFGRDLSVHLRGRMRLVPHPNNLGRDRITSSGGSAGKGCPVDEVGTTPAAGAPGRWVVSKVLRLYTIQAALEQIEQQILALDSCHRRRVCRDAVPHVSERCVRLPGLMTARADRLFV